MKKHLPLIARISIFILFMLSAIAKMIDYTWKSGFSNKIWAFEKQLRDLDIANFCTAPYYARIIIAIEIAIAIAILQGHHIKKMVVPFTIGLLVVFNIHLATEMYKHGAMNGNCGCFGQLIPMTPLEAFIKNLAAIAILLYIYKKVNDKEPGQNKSIYLLLIYLASALFMFIFFPFCPCVYETEKTVNNQGIAPDTNSLIPTLPLIDTTNNREITKTPKGLISKEIIPAVKPLIIEGPKKTKSKFSKYTSFGSTKVNLDEGKKILCMFVPGCEHCRDACKEIGKMSKKEGFPEVFILFMDEESELIPEFFKVTQTSFPYQVIDILDFWKTIGSNANTPGVVYLHNGNIEKFYEGTEGNQFNAEGFLKAIEKK